MPNTLDATLHLQVHQIIHTTGQTVEDIYCRYFRGSHQWLPFIHERKFRTRLADPTTADVSILLLSMCLITYYPVAAAGSDPLVDQQSLYLATKMLFAQTQSLVPVSSSLVQASVLISVYEYAHGLFQNAHISIGVSARLASSSGLGAFRHAVDEQEDSELFLEAEERRILWCGIVICERYEKILLLRNH